MTLRERILTVYRGETPDVVPFMLDLSHWFYQRHHLPWDLSRSYDRPEHALIDYHRQVGAGFYMPNLGAFYAADYDHGVESSVERTVRDGQPEITWTLATAHGRIRRTRVWEEGTYAWGIRNWGISTPDDLQVLGEALAGRRYHSDWAQYRQWVDCVGDMGVVYLLPGYSAMGQLLNYWMGVERVMYAVSDWPNVVHEVVDRINDNNLILIDLLASSPAEVICLGDNFSSDIQPPHFFAEWSRPFYAEATRRLHAAGKYVAVHIDGRLRGSLRMFADIGMDGADAVTPKPMGDLTPEECRREAGPGLILSGGVSPNLWLPNVDTDTFRHAVRSWLALRTQSPRLIANAGDQVPPGAVEERIAIMRDMVEQYGQY